MGLLQAKQLVCFSSWGLACVAWGFGCSFVASGLAVSSVINSSSLAFPVLACQIVLSIFERSL